MCRERKDETWQSRWCLQRSSSNLVRVVWLGLYVGWQWQIRDASCWLGWPPGMSSGKQLLLAGDTLGGPCGEPRSAGTGFWGRSVLLPVCGYGGTASASAEGWPWLPRLSEQHLLQCWRILQEQRAEAGSLANSVPSYIFLCFLGCLSLHRILHITNFKFCCINSLPIWMEAVLLRLSEVPLISVPGVFRAALQSCEDLQNLCQGLSTQPFSLREGSSWLCRREVRVAFREWVKSL